MSDQDFYTRHEIASASWELGKELARLELQICEKHEDLSYKLWMATARLIAAVEVVQLENQALREKLAAQTET